MSEEKKVEMLDIFSSLQEEMLAKLEVGRKSIPHATSKGDDSEEQWIKWLKTYLPNRYSVKKAFVIDSNGNLSEQIDVVVFDQQYTPFILHHEGAIYIPAEGVYGVFEVKQTLNKEYVKYAKEKAHSVRVLKRTSAPIPHAGGVYKSKDPIPILAGLLTYKSDWNPPFGDSLKSELIDSKLSERLNLLCSLCDGSMEVKYNDEIEYNVVPKDKSLVFFFLKLFSMLQSVGTVAAMDIDEYIKAIS